MSFCWKLTDANKNIKDKSQKCKFCSLKCLQDHIHADCEAIPKDDERDCVDLQGSSPDV